MKNTVVLEMLKEGRIDELKSLLTDEIYQDSLKKNVGAKERYAAMKRYFKYVDKPNPCCHYPCDNVKVNGEIYNGFVDGYSFVITKEPLGEMDTYNEEEHGSYFKLEGFVNRADYTEVDRVDINKVLAKAKSKGYKLKKAEMKQDFRYMLRYKNGGYKMSLLDRAFSIVNDGSVAKVYYKDRLGMLMIETSIGIAGILPVNLEKIDTSQREKIFADEMIIQ
nr:MAG TPA: hypothetical protein [Caudoviricetes sp.]